MLLMILLFLFYDKTCQSPPLVLPVSDTQISHCMPGIGPPPPAHGGTDTTRQGPPHEHTHSTPHSVGFLWTSDQNSTYQQGTTFTIERHPRNPVGFEPVFPASRRPQTPALDRLATVGIYLCSIIP